MDEYLQKYLDGDLDDDEAAAFARALETDPQLEAELRAFERMLAVATEDIDREPSAGFSDAVMMRVRARGVDAPATGLLRRLLGDGRAWGVRAALAAGFALVFMVGYFTARQGREAAPAGPAADVASGVTDGSGASVTGMLRLTRLVYVPENPEVRQVAVAGTFNDWNPEATAMVRRGGVWVVQLLLPPETYEYMFVEDGQRWVTDPLAVQTRDDGFGTENAVLDLEI